MGGYSFIGALIRCLEAEIRSSEATQRPQKSMGDLSKIESRVTPLALVSTRRKQGGDTDLFAGSLCFY